MKWPGGKKLWKQKGTDAAYGSIRSPLWRHGGRHMVRNLAIILSSAEEDAVGALKSALSAKLRDGELRVVSESHRRAEDQADAQGARYYCDQAQRAAGRK